MKNIDLLLALAFIASIIALAATCHPAFLIIALFAISFLFIDIYCKETYF